jgi:hypothetical protein
MNESFNKKSSNGTLLSQNDNGDSNFKTFYVTIEKDSDVDDMGLELAENEGPLFIDYESNQDKCENMKNNGTKVSKSLNHVHLNYSSTNNKKLYANRLRRHRTSEFNNNHNIYVKTSNHIFISHVRSTSILFDKLRYFIILFH